MVWIIGEYAERIDNADELLESFLESFQDENSLVQLQLLTATVKLFLKRPKDTQALVQMALNMATQESDNPDLRDRGFVYWRLLSTDPEAAKAVVLSEKPLITDASIRMDESLLDELIGYISSLASVYHKPPETFVSKLRDVKSYKPKVKKKALAIAQAGGLQTSPAQQRKTPTPAEQPSQVADLLDLGGLGEALPAQSTPAAPTSSGGSVLDDLSFLGGQSGAARQVHMHVYVASLLIQRQITKEVLLPVEKGKGMQITGAFKRDQDKLLLDLTFSNQTSIPLSGLAIQFNKNTYV